MTTNTNDVNPAIITACDDLREGKITYAEWLKVLESVNVTVTRDDEER